MAQYKLLDIEYVGGCRRIPTATVIVAKPDGSEVKDAAQGNGPVDAIVHAIQRALGIQIEVLEFSVSSIGSGSSAEGRAATRIKWGGVEYQGVGVHTDIIIASAKAVADALNNPVPTEPSIAPYAYVA